MRYIHIHRLAELPDISNLAPFKTVISIEEPASEQRRAEISAWLVDMGCRYVMPHGEASDVWCDSVRHANLEAFDIDTMSAQDFVMTTGHRYEPLKAVFWFAKKVAIHPEVQFKECVVLHLARGDRSLEYQGIYQRA